MLIVVRRSNARSACSFGFKPILSKRADCRSPADGGVHAGGGVCREGRLAAASLPAAMTSPLRLAKQQSVLENRANGGAPCLGTT
jgi:hypothetical protein